MASSFRVSASFLNGLKALFPENPNAVGSTLQPPSMHFFGISLCEAINRVFSAEDSVVHSRRRRI